MRVEGHFVLLSGKCNLFIMNVSHLCYKTKHFFFFLLGNVYFDVKSWGKRYGVLTTIFPDAQDEAGMFMAVTCSY